MRPHPCERAPLFSSALLGEECRQRGHAEPRFGEGSESLANPGVELGVELLDLGDLEILPPAANQGVQPSRERLVALPPSCIDDPLRIGLKPFHGFRCGNHVTPSEMEA